MAIPTSCAFYPYLAGYVALYAGDYRQRSNELQNGRSTDPFTFSLLAQAYEKSGEKAKAVSITRRS